MLDQRHYEFQRALICTLLLGCVFFAGVNAFAADPAAQIIESRGEVSISRAANNAAEGNTGESFLYAGDTLITGATGRATMLLSDESLVQVNRNTRLTLNAVEKSAGWLPVGLSDSLNSLYELATGEIWFRNKNIDTDVRIETPHVAIGVRGTEFVVRVTADPATEVDMLEGVINAANEFGEVDAFSGEQVYAAPGVAPVKRLLLNPDNAVQWTLRIPALLGDELSSIQGSAGDSDQLLSAAWTALLAGNADRATELAMQATELDPDYVLGWQLLALIQLVANQPEQALASIGNAQALDARNVQSLLLESYIRQAGFDLPAALAADQQALRFEPGNSQALIDIARLHFGMGDLEKAQKYLDRLLNLIDNSEALNLSGFLALARGDTRVSLGLFAAAIAADPGYAEPHLGSGLAHMRLGDTPQAMQAVSAAAALEPTKALYLSYWGKLLYELKRYDRAAETLDRAIELDPRDPTPWFLKALVLRDTNRYGEAIRAYNRAVELNDNRAVYRSRFLLDRDLATRNINLSLVFDRYNFNAWADRKAVDAVDDDYTNFGSHVTYAGALSSQERRDVAFLSETLQARILQPGNANAFNTFNQYTSFVEKPTAGISARAIRGSFDIRGYEAEIFGAVPDNGLAFQGAFTDTQSDGWNGTNGDEVRDVSGIVKWDVNVNNSLMFAFSDFDTTLFDDEFQRFEFDDVPDPTAQTDRLAKRFEFGYTHSVSPVTDLMAYMAFVELKDRSVFTRVVDDRSGGFFIDFDTGTQDQTTDRTHGRLQLLLKTSRGDHEWILGTSNYLGKNNTFRSELVINSLGLVGGSPPTETVRLTRTFDTERNARRAYHSAYLQDTWQTIDWLQLEGALYYDYLRNSEPLARDTWRETHLNPRLGAVMEVNEQDTVRLSAVRYTAPFFSAQLSPTDTAGLTVYRNFLEGALVREANVAWEREWETGFLSINGFLNSTRAEARLVPDITIQADQTKYDVITPFIGRGRIKGVELELNQMLGNRFGFVSRYLLAGVNDNFDTFSARNENRLELELSFNHPVGIFARVRQGLRFLDMRFRTSNERIRYTDVELSYETPAKNLVVRFEGRNIFNNHFNWVTDRFTLGGVIPKRNWLLSAEVNF